MRLANRALVGGAMAVVACGKSGAEAPAPAPAAAVAAHGDAHRPAVERRLYAAQVEASSFLESRRPPYPAYHPNYVMDGDPKTAWNEGAPGDGPGEWLKIPLTRQRAVSHVRLRILDGYHKSKAIYQANARAKTIEIRTLPNGAPTRHALVDQMIWQEVAFDTSAATVDAIELRVVDVYPGTKYKDLCISEVDVYLTSESPEDPELEKQQLDKLLVWKQHQIEAAEVMASDVGQDEYEYKARAGAAIPEAATEYIARASHATGAKLQRVELRARRDGELFAGSMGSCLESDDGPSCVTPLLTNAGLAVTPVAETSACEAMFWQHPTASGGELVISTCREERMRERVDRNVTYYILEYDPAGRLRLIAHDDAIEWFEWGKRETGGWRITGGVARRGDGTIRELVPIAIEPKQDP